MKTFKQFVLEYSAFIGGKIGGGERSITVSGGAKGASGSLTFGTKKTGGGTDPKDSIDAALTRLGDSHVGGKSGPQVYAKSAPTRDVPFVSGSANYSGSAGSSLPRPTRPTTPNNPRVGKDPNKTINSPKPMDVRRPVEGPKPMPMDVRKPVEGPKPMPMDVRKPMPMDVRKPIVEPRKKLGDFQM